MGVTIVDFQSWLVERAWIGPLMGIVVFGLAFVAGRRLLARKPPPEEEAPEARFGADYLLGVTRERRAGPRRKGNQIEVRLDDGSGAGPVVGLVLDRSVGGLGLLTDAPIEAGTVLKVRPTQAPETTPSVEVTVRSCKQRGRQYELGCQFHRTPDWNVMLQFG